MSMQHFDAIIVGRASAASARRSNSTGWAMKTSSSSTARTTSAVPGMSTATRVLPLIVPSTTYSYWFEPNPYWSRLYAPGAELKRYAEHVADKYNVRRYMRFNTTVEGARWDDEAQLWQVALAGGETLSAQFLIAATGFLCQPRTPDIPGIETFHGRIVHAAEWDDSYSFDGRRAAIIGTGSTGVQLIPELAKKASELTVYQRTPIWVMPKIDFGFSPAVQRLFARVPLAQRIVRWFTDNGMDVMMVIAMWKFRYFKRAQHGRVERDEDPSVSVDP